VTVRVVVAEDSLLVRAAVVRLLAEAGVDVVAEAGDGDDLVRKVRAHRPDVAIVDIRMPPTQIDEGIRAARAIRGECPEVGILLLSQYVEESYATDLLECGADGVGYLLKERVADVAQFVEAVRQVAARQAVLDPEVVAHMLGGRRREAALAALDDREREVLARMAEGASNRAIAARMFLSERAVERSVTQIFDRLGLRASRQVHRRVLAVLAYLRER
jgi:DNA-binding NarL/FixJ family response regulator